MNVTVTLRILTLTLTWDSVCGQVEKEVLALQELARQRNSQLHTSSAPLDSGTRPLAHVEPPAWMLHELASRNQLDMALYGAAKRAFESALAPLEAERRDLTRAAQEASREREVARSKARHERLDRLHRARLQWQQSARVKRASARYALLTMSVAGLLWCWWRYGQRYGRRRLRLKFAPAAKCGQRDFNHSAAHSGPKSTTAGSLHH